jgi:hypothetical protein
MQALQSRDLLSSDTHTMTQLHDFLRQRREARKPALPSRVTDTCAGWPWSWRGVGYVSSLRVP